MLCTSPANFSPATASCSFSPAICSSCSTSHTYTGAPAASFCTLSFRASLRTTYTTRAPASVNVLAICQATLFLFATPKTRIDLPASCRKSDIRRGRKGGREEGRKGGRGEGTLYSVLCTSYKAPALPNHFDFGFTA